MEGGAWGGVGDGGGQRGRGPGKRQKGGGRGRGGGWYWAGKMALGSFCTMEFPAIYTSLVTALWLRFVLR